MAWLMFQNRVLATLEEADTFKRRIVGLLGRTDFEGALLLHKTKGIHTFGMKFELDTAFLDKDLTVLSIKVMPPWRIAMPSLRTKYVLEARSGAFERWEINVGCRLEIKR
jgi:uncharacterized membrane protein (UPF0127 family)